MPPSMGAIRRSEENAASSFEGKGGALFWPREDKGEFRYATPQNRSRGNSWARADVGFGRSHGAVSTYESGFESAGMGETHGSTAGERVGNRAVRGFAVVGE